jgi:hypothetical protein
MGAPWSTSFIKEIIMSKVIHIHLHKATKDTLQGGSSKAAFSHNVKTEVAAGKPVKQAVAIAYSKKRETNDAGPTSSGEEHWITVNGAHVKISGKGEIVAGPKQLKQALEHHGKQAKHHESQMLERSGKGEHKEARQHQEARNHHQLAGENLKQAANWKAKGEKTWSQAQASIAGFHAGKAAEIEKGLTTKTLPSSNNKSSAQLRSEAYELGASGKHKEAAEAYEQAIENYPPHHPGSSLAKKDKEKLAALAARHRNAAKSQ